MITSSIVIHNTPDTYLQKIITCLAGSIVDKIYIVDNASHENPREFVQNLSPKIIYIQNPSNVGYGAANNIAIQEAILQGAQYHLVINPDIEFEEGVLDHLAAFMDSHPDVGVVLPKVLYPNGKTQFLCKLLPTPVDLIFRRFLPSSLPISRKRTERYELREMCHSSTHFEVPFLSGCFLFLRVETLKQVGLFDERFFLYLEDVDLCRRIQNVARTAFFPQVAIAHCYAKGSYKSSKLLWHHILSALKYFNKWGWFFDKERRRINNQFLVKLHHNDQI